MRYFLLHVSTFVPILTKLLLAPLGLKISWAMYLFFTYILLEEKKFNGYEIDVFENLQKQSECAMMLSLFLSHWISPLLAPFTFAIVLWKVQIDPLIYSISAMLLFKYDAIQIFMVALCIVSSHMYVKEQIVSVETWRRNVHRRLMFRGVQVFCLLICYEKNYVRLIITAGFLLLKFIVFTYTAEEKIQDFPRDSTGPVSLFQRKNHHL